MEYTTLRIMPLKLFCSSSPIKSSSLFIPEELCVRRERYLLYIQIHTFTHRWDGKDHRDEQKSPFCQKKEQKIPMKTILFTFALLKSIMVRWTAIDKMYLGQSVICQIIFYLNALQWIIFIDWFFGKQFLTFWYYGRVIPF